LKSYEELTIRDHFMFGKICQDPTICEIILSALLNQEISLTVTDTEKYFKEYNETKFVRLDLLAKTDNGTIYNAEMQHKSKNADRQKELLLRSRYYQAMNQIF